MSADKENEMETDPPSLTDVKIPEHLQNAVGRPHSPTGPPNFVPSQPSPEPVTLTAAALNAKGQPAPKLPLDKRAIAMLIEELTKDDLQVRLNAMRHLPYIAKALGPARTREELVPYLKSLIDDDDEVLLVMCQELLNLIPFMGGKAHVHHLFLPFETLCVVEEAQTRELAIDGVTKVIEQTPPSVVEKEGVAMVTRLIQSDWHTARVSGVMITPAVWGRSSQKVRLELQKLFLPLASDTMPMVRRGVVQALEKFVVEDEKENEQKEEDKPVLKDWLLPAFTGLCKDDQDGVRLYCVNTLVAVGRALDGTDNAKLLPLIRAACLDTSWRVRYVAADTFVSLLDIKGLTEVDRTDRMSGLYKQLLQDAEAEVRASAIGRVPEVARRIGSKMFRERIVPIVEKLVTDPSKHARAALANQIMSLFSTDVLPKELSINQILPLVLQLLRDEYPEVRLNVIRNLDDAATTFGLDNFTQSLIPSIRELSTDANWRVRTGIINLSPNLAKNLGESFFAKIDPTPMAWLSDSVACVREAGSINLVALGSIFGDEWIVTKLIPSLVKKGKEAGRYLERVIVLDALERLAPQIPKEGLVAALAHACHSTKDPVPNCRMKACETLKALVLRAKALNSENGLEETKKALEAALQQDKDRDVQDLSKATLDKMRELFA